MGKRMSAKATAKDFESIANTATAETATVNNTVAPDAEPVNPPVEVIDEKDTIVVMADTKAINAHLKALDDCFKGIEKTFFKVAFNLHWFYKTNAYVEINGKGYANIEQFARDRYGISKPTTYNYINIVDKFGHKTDTGEITELETCYKDFSSTKLLCMLPMDDETLMKCTPKMTVAEIKKLALSVKSIETKEDIADTDTADAETSDRKSVTRTVYEHTQELYSIKSVDELDKRANEILDAIRKSLSQQNGTEYGISISMFW